MTGSATNGGDEDVVVHGLLHGQPLCRFTTVTPNQWPPGNVWTHIENSDAINCPGCKTEVERIQKTKQ